MTEGSPGPLARALGILTVWIGGMMVVYWAFAFVALETNPLEWATPLRTTFSLLAFTWLGLLVVVDTQVNR